MCEKNSLMKRRGKGEVEVKKKISIIYKNDV